MSIKSHPLLVSMPLDLAQSIIQGALAEGKGGDLIH